jgi:hypothetical protein
MLKVSGGKSAEENILVEEGQNNRGSEKIS